MSSSQTSPASPVPRWNERPQRWLAALVSALVHVLFVAILLWSSKPLVTTPQGSSSGGRVRVDFVGEPAPPTPPVPANATPRERPKVPVPPSPAVLRDRIDDERLIIADEPESESTPQLPTPPQPPTAQPPAPRPSAEQAQRRPETWTGRPPGFIEEDMTPLGDSRVPGSSNQGNRGNDIHPGTPSMDVGGYQVIYELLAEARLREWMDTGMTEIGLPLPGTRYWMVCPAEVALRREGSKCRLLDPSDPEMKAVGDAREVISVHSVYHKGERVWRGPGAYR